MKRLLLMALAAAMLTPACGNNAGKETKAEVQESAAVQANVTHLTKADFLAKVYNYEKNPKEWKYEGGKPAIVDFYATWCGPCKAIAPVLEKLAAEYKGKIVVYKIDTDKEPELSAAFGIRSIPTLLFIPAKGTPQVAQGALPEEALRRATRHTLPSVCSRLTATATTYSSAMCGCLCCASNIPHVRASRTYRLPTSSVRRLRA
jgi:thioredoxin